LKQTENTRSARVLYSSQAGFTWAYGLKLYRKLYRGHGHLPWVGLTTVTTRSELYMSGRPRHEATMPHLYYLIGPGRLLGFVLAGSKLTTSSTLPLSLPWQNAYHYEIVTITAGPLTNHLRFRAGDQLRRSSYAITPNR